MLLDTDVLIKTQKGRTEIHEQGIGLLPREARTLLILVNGHDTVGQYRRALSGTKAFESEGKIEQLISLLIDLEYLEIAQRFDAEVDDALDSTPADAVPNGEGHTHTDDSVTSTTPERRGVDDDIIHEEDIVLESFLARASQSPSPQDGGQQASPARPAPVPPLLGIADARSPRAFEALRRRIPGNTTKAAPPVALDEVRSALADLFETHPRLQDRWTWLFHLEECRDASDFRALIDQFEQET
ncbi:MAG: hypothetical protein AAFX85_13205, partial [Pseudomonadota bacterium]